MERLIEITPAFDRRDPDPSKSGGIHGAEIRMVLKGDKGKSRYNMDGIRGSLSVLAGRK